MKKQTYNWYELMSELVDIADKANKELDEDCIDCRAGSMIAPDCTNYDKTIKEINNGNSQTLQIDTNNRNRYELGDINRLN